MLDLLDAPTEDHELTVTESGRCSRDGGFIRLSHSRNRATCTACGRSADRPDTQSERDYIRGRSVEKRDNPYTRS